MNIPLVASSRMVVFYGSRETTEEYLCNYAGNSQYTHLFADNEFRIAGSDTEGDARVIGNLTHPFLSAPCSYHRTVQRGAHLMC